jgi:hypothetical protein
VALLALAWIAKEAHADLRVWSSNGPPEAGPITALVIVPTDPPTIYAGSAGGHSGGAGLFVSVDGGNSWDSAGLGTRQVLAIAIDPSRPATVYVGTFGDGVFTNTSGTGGWVQLNKGLPSGDFCSPVVTTLVAASTSPTTLYAVASGGSSGCDAGIFESTSTNDSWFKVGRPTGFNIATLTVDPQDPATLYAGSSPGGAAVSTDGGQSWDDLSTGLPASLPPSDPPIPVGVNSLLVDPAVTSTLYAATDAGGFKYNSGFGWAKMLNFPGGNALAITATTSSTIYAAASKSLDGGASWSPVGDGLQAEVTSLAVDPANPSIVCAGTSTADAIMQTGAVFCIDQQFTPTNTPTPTTSPSVTGTPAMTPSPTSTLTPTPIESPSQSWTQTTTPSTTRSLTPTPPTCVGDCDGNRAVSIDELISGIDVTLGTLPLERCQRINCNGEAARATVDCLTDAVSNALYGCGTPPPTRTATLAPTATPTKTFTTTTTATRTPTATHTLLPSATPTPTVSNVSGEWAGAWHSRLGPSGLFSAALSRVGAAITGTVVFSGTLCFPKGTVSGTVTGTSWAASVSAGSAQINLVGTVSGGQFSGTYSVSSGDCAGDTGTFAASFVASPINVGGQWSGTWQSEVNLFAGGLLSVSLNQTGIAVGGTVTTFTGSPCFSGGTISGTEIANVWSASLTAAGGFRIDMSGTVGANIISGGYYVVVGGLCTGDFGVFNLVR